MILCSIYNVVVYFNNLIQKQLRFTKLKVTEDIVSTETHSEAVIYECEVETDECEDMFLVNNYVMLLMQYRHYYILVQQNFLEQKESDMPSGPTPSTVDNVSCSHV